MKVERNMRTDIRWMLVLRVLALMGAAFLFFLGITYNSVAWGFRFKENYAWVGVGFAILCTVLEIIWNHEASRANASIMVFGIFAYLFGLGANGIGIYSTIQDTENMGVSGWLFLFIVAVIIELVPEPLAIFAITGGWSGGDAVMQTIMILTGRATTPPVPMARYNMTTNQPKQTQVQPQRSPQGQSRPPQQYRQAGGSGPAPDETFQRRLRERAKELNIRIDD